MDFSALLGRAALASGRQQRRAPKRRKNPKSKYPTISDDFFDWALDPNYESGCTPAFLGLFQPDVPTLLKVAGDLSFYQEVSV